MSLREVGWVLTVTIAKLVPKQPVILGYYLVDTQILPMPDFASTFGSCIYLGENGLNLHKVSGIASLKNLMPSCEGSPCEEKECEPCLVVTLEKKITIPAGREVLRIETPKVIGVPGVSCFDPFFVE
jgi:hypothetical protein